jgi:hypothetical protein
VILKDGVEKCNWGKNGSKLQYFSEPVWLEWQETTFPNTEVLSIGSETHTVKMIKLGVLG